MSNYDAGLLLEHIALIAQAAIQIWLLLHVRLHFETTRVSIWAALALVVDALVRGGLYFFSSTPAAKTVFGRWKDTPQNLGHALFLLTEKEDTVRVVTRILTLAWALAILFWRVANMLYYERGLTTQQRHPFALSRAHRVILAFACLPVFTSWIAMSCHKEFSNDKDDYGIIKDWTLLPSRIQLCAAGPFGPLDGIATTIMMLTWREGSWPVEGYLVGKMFVVAIALSSRLMHDLNESGTLIDRGPARESLLLGNMLQCACLVLLLGPRLWKHRPLVAMALTTAWVGAIWLSRAVAQGLLGRVIDIHHTKEFANILVSMHLLGLLAGGTPAIMLGVGLGNWAMRRMSTT